MKHPTFPEQNYAMHILAASFVELFPNLQFLDFSVFPDRFCIDFSFARTLSMEELQMLKDRFFLKIKRKDRGEVKEMVSKNACDMLKHYKQIFLTDLIDREEMFVKMLCMDLYNAPLIGEIDQEGSFNQLKLEMFDQGKKKWMSRNVHHFRVEGFVFYSKEDKISSLSQLHQEIGKKESLFWVEGGRVAFSGKGEEAFESILDLCSKHFGEKVYFDFEPASFAAISEMKDFYMLISHPGDYNGIDYGLKQTNFTRSIVAFSFSEKDLASKVKQFVSELGLVGEFDKQGKLVVYDYKGIPWVVGENNDSSKSFTIEINLQCLFALMLEKRVQ